MVVKMQCARAFGNKLFFFWFGVSTNKYKMAVTQLEGINVTLQLYEP